MFVCVSGCVVVFDSVGLCFYVEGCMVVKSKYIRMGICSYVGQVKLYTWEGCCKPFCFLVVRVGTLFLLTYNRMTRGRYVD